MTSMTSAHPHYDSNGRLVPVPGCGHLPGGCPAPCQISALGDEVISACYLSISR